MRPTPHDAAIVDVLRRHFGFDSLRPMQREAIDAAVAGRDALVVLPTGGGKSLCYQVPPMITGKLTLVVSPLIALMQDQVEGLRLNGYPAAAVHSNVDAAGRVELQRLVASGELRLLFVAPERLFVGDFLDWLSRFELGAVAIDEAHCISQWGHDFRPEYRRLAELRQRLSGVSFHAFTATATPRVRADVIDQLHLRDPEVLVGTFDRPNLTYRVLPRVDLEQQVVEAIGRHPDAAAIVYCIARKDTEALVERLRARRIEAAAYHAGLDGGTRTRVSADFRAERLHVVVATVAFGMGIDRGDVRLVVHAAMPKSIEHYQQETGRAGRDGLPAECLLLYTGADAAKWRVIIERGAAEMGADPATVTAQLDLLRQMQRLAGGASCRHRALSEYFGQDYPAASCDACDSCLHELVPVAEAQTTAQKILSAVARTGQRFGAAYVIDVLRGSRNQKVLQRGHDAIPTFGLLKDVPAQRLGNYVDQLVDAGDLARSTGDYPVLTLTEGSLAVLRDERQVSLVAPQVAIAAETRRRRGRRRGGGAELSAPERELFEKLRALRRTLAAERAVAPYMVFSDVALEELARVRPSDPERMLQVKGIGERKVESFGEAVLQVVDEHCAAAELARDADLDDPGVAPPTSPPPARTPTAQEVRQRAAELFERGMPIAEVARELERAVRTTVGYLAELIAAGQVRSIRPWVDENDEARVAEVLRDAESDRLKPVFEALGGEVPYDTIRLVMAWLERAEDGSAEAGSAEAGSTEAGSTEAAADG